VSLWGLLIPIRRTFNQRINLRPIRRLPGIAGPLRSDEPIDLVVVRENVEGEYSEIGGRLYPGSADEIAVQESVFTRRGVEAVMRFSFELATTRRRELTSATKSNGIIHTMPFWDEIFEELAGDHSGVATRRVHIDALAAELVLKPQVHDVIVASNLFGDILSDLGAAVAGSLGTAPSANIDPSGEHPSMFEPIHGSAPDIAGQGIANPIATCWSAAMMLEHFGHFEAAASMITAIETVTEQGDPLTPDLGGTATTEAVGQALLNALP
jgi:tartrate dehydrogenase/decarboxylase/D-malate dehydrogenase